MVSSLRLLNNYNENIKGAFYCPFHKREVVFDDLTKLKQHIIMSHNPGPKQKKALLSLISYCTMGFMIGLVRCKP